MKINPVSSLSTLRLATAALFLMVAYCSPASAGTSHNYSGVRVANPPPHDRPDHRWQSPSRDAIWIAGHYDWIHGRWVWVGGYYTYPPHLGAKWVPARYQYERYFVGHWER